MSKGARVASVLLVTGIAGGGVLYALQSGSDAQAGAVLQPDDAAVVAAGAAVYVQHCASCHGERLQGQPTWRQRGADGLLPAPPHDPSGHTWHHDDRLLVQLTKYGPAALAGGGYRSAMPGYEGVLSDAQIVAVLSYIKSTWPQEIRARHDALNERASKR